MQTAIATIIVFGLIVFIHELGHYLVAKKVGILVREFAIGFGPKIFSFKKDETTYTIRALPLGGFVKMAGEDVESYELKTGMKIGLQLDADNSVIRIDSRKNLTGYQIIGRIEQFEIENEMYIRIEHEEGSSTYKVSEQAIVVKENEEMQVAPLHRKFNGKTVGQRAATIFAGPLMNFVLAGFLFAIVIYSIGIPTERSIIGQAIPGMPAYEAGLTAGDEIIAIDGEPVTTWSNLVTLINARPEQKVVFEVIPVGSNEKVVFDITTLSEDGIGKVGISPQTEDAGLMSIVYGFQRTYDMTVLLFSYLGQMFTGKVEPDVAGPVGIVQIIGTQANEGILQLISLAGFLSLNLGIINLFPIPALDGGRLVFIGLEAVRGKPLDPNKEGFIHFIGFALLMLLIVVVTYNDIARIFS